MKVLVAGATGVLGSEVTNALTARGHSVRAIGRSAERLERLANVESRVVQMQSSGDMQSAMSGVDAVFSCLGASPHPSLAGGRATFCEVDVPLNRHIINAAVASGRPRFVYVSVFRAGEFPDIAYLRAHEDVVALLKASRLPSAVVRPTGFFSAYKTLIDLAKKGPLFEINRGVARTNPIHETDLAEICADAIEGKTGDVEAGGPETVSRRELDELAFAAAGKRPRFIQAPRWLADSAPKLIRPFHPRIGDLAAFLGLVLRADFVAPAWGSRSLRAYFHSI